MGDDLDIDSLLEDLSVLDSPDRSNKPASFAPAPTASATTAASANEDIDENSLEALLSLMPEEIGGLTGDAPTATTTATAPTAAPPSGAPPCDAPLRRRRLRPSSGGPATASASSSPPGQTAAAGGGGGAAVSPLALGDPSAVGMSIIAGGSRASPPASPQPEMPVESGIAKFGLAGAGDNDGNNNNANNNVNVTEGPEQEQSHSGTEVGIDFDYDVVGTTAAATAVTTSSSTCTSIGTGSRPGSAASRRVIAAAVADGTVPSIDPDSLNDEISAMLGDYSDAGAEAGADASANSRQMFQALPAAPNPTGTDNSNKLRCIRASVTGSAVKKGYKQSSFARDVSCSSMRCIKCNFSIRIFDKAKWELTADGSDYLFLRNSFPNDGKLSAKLCADASSCAYCCQCGWANATEGSDVDVKELQLQWNCSGHPSA